MMSEAVAAALEGEGFEVRRVVIDHSIEPHLEELARRGEVAFLALHGRYGEDGTVQQALERAEIAYTGSGPRASRSAMRKPEAKRLFEAAGIATPKYTVAGRGTAARLDVELRREGLVPPLVVKPAASGSSIGVTVVREPGGLADAVTRALELGEEVLVEAFVEGRELTVGVLEGPAHVGAGLSVGRDNAPGKALPVVEMLPAREFYDYAAKYEDEATGFVCPAELDGDELARIQQAGVAAFEALGCRDFGRTDVMLPPSGVATVLEVNTIPGFTSHSLLPRSAAAAGVGFGELAGRIVRLAAQRARG
jgi:D-alanine-D-alanine ligase